MSGSLGRRAALLVGGGYRDFENPKAGGGTDTLPTTGYDELPIDGKLDVWTDDGRIHVRLAGYAFDPDDVRRTHATARAKPYRDSQVGSNLERRFDQTHRLFYARSARTDPGGLVEAAHLTLPATSSASRTEACRATRSITSARARGSASTCAFAGGSRTLRTAATACSDPA